VREASISLVLHRHPADVAVNVTPRWTGRIVVEK
jgi:hypothetical protein